MGAKEKNEDILGRLDAAIDALKTEFLDAHHGLAKEVSHTNDRIGNLIRVLSGKTLSNGSRKEVDTLRDALVEHTRMEGAATQHVEDLEHTANELRNEVALLRSQEAWLIAANQDMSERLVDVRADAKHTAKALDEAHAEIARLTKAFEEQTKTVQTFGRELDVARSSREGKSESVEQLAAEVATLRRANTRLHACLEDAEAKAHARERQQRILLESVLANGNSRKLGELLVAASVITQAQLQEALHVQESTRNRMLGSILVSRGHAAESEVAQAVACQLKLPLVSLVEETVMPSAARLVDRALCEECQCIPLRSTDNRLFVAMCNPRDETAVQRIEKVSGRRVTALVATPTDVGSAITTVFGPH